MNTLNMNDIDKLAKRASKAAHDLGVAKAELADAKARLKAETATLLAAAYSDGIIIGKNADQRHQSETAYVETHPILDDYRLDVKRKEENAIDAETEAVYIDTYIKLLRAALYAISNKS